MISAIRTQVGVNMGDHAQDVNEALDVTANTTIGELADTLRRTRWVGVDRPRETDPGSYQDFITIRLVRPLPEATNQEGPF